MIFYKFDYVIEKTLKNDMNREQKILREFTGEIFAPAEAKSVWERVLDHKWYMSERLNRDVGLRVAAVDFVENFYAPFSGKKSSGQNRNKMQNHVLSPTIVV
jgi:hypothetical protein